jgi:drug/metabolite transporter (DMT)-like permease
LGEEQKAASGGNFVFGFGSKIIGVGDMGFASAVTWIFLSLMVFLTTLGQLLIKWGMIHVGPLPSDFRAWPLFLLHALTQIQVICGLGCAICAALSWIVVVSRTPLSFAYPFSALAIVLTLALSGALLHEHIPFNRWMGVAIVCIGLIVASAK